jgi:hypothetical protein
MTAQRKMHMLNIVGKRNHYRVFNACLSAVLLPALTGCGAILGTTPTSNPNQSDNVTPILPYQAGDEQLSCSELNKEIGKLNERVSRLIDQNELKEARKDESSPYLGALFSAMIGVKRKLSNVEEQQYGTDTGHLIQTYQERIEHLDKISQSRSC